MRALVEGPSRGDALRALCALAEAVRGADSAAAAASASAAAGAPGAPGDAFAPLPSRGEAPGAALRAAALARNGGASRDMAAQALCNVAEWGWARGHLAAAGALATLLGVANADGAGGCGRGGGVGAWLCC